MERVTLQNAPTELSPTYEVRDYLDNGVYARLVFKLDSTVDQHIVVHAQAFEMDEAGNFKQANIGIPSRTPNSGHTLVASAFPAKQASFNDAWLKQAADYDPVAGPGDTVQGEGPPTEDGTEYGQKYFDTVAEQMWEWRMGWLDQLAKDKMLELQAILASSNVISGVGFR